MELAQCSYIVLGHVCNNCIKEHGGKIVCLGEGCALVDKDKQEKK